MRMILSFWVGTHLSSNSCKGCAYIQMLFAGLDWLKAEEIRFVTWVILYLKRHHRVYERLDQHLPLRDYDGIVVTSGHRSEMESTQQRQQKSWYAGQKQLFQSGVFLRCVWPSFFRSIAWLWRKNYLRRLGIEYSFLRFSPEGSHWIYFLSPRVPPCILVSLGTYAHSYCSSCYVIWADWPWGWMDPRDWISFSPLHDSCHLLRFHFDFEALSAA